MFLFRDRDAGQNKGAVVAGFEFDIDHDDLLEMLEDLPGGERWCLGRGEFLEADMHGVAEEGDHDVGFNPRLELVPDGAHLDFAFQGAEGGFGLGELDIGLPEARRIVRASGPMGAQEVGPIAVDRGFPFALVPLPLEAAVVAGAVFEEPPVRPVAFLEVSDAAVDGFRVLEFAFGDEVAQFDRCQD